MRINFQSNNRNLSYTKEGNGFPVVFVHGFCEDLTMWNAFQPLDLSKYSILKIDMPGFGQSDVDHSLSMTSIAKDIKAVLDREQIDTCIYIGHSMGAYVGLAFAEYYPDFLKGFGLFHSHPYADSEEQKSARTKANEFIVKHGSKLLVKQLIPKLFAEEYLAQNEVLVNNLVSYGCTFTADGIRTANAAMLQRKDRASVLEQLDCPVLFIAGDQDYAVPTDVSLEMIFLPSVASIHMLRGCGHMGMYERKEETEEIVREFVAFCL